MGTRKKLVLASLVSAMMVLACLIGLVPAQDPADIGAGSSSGRLDVKDILDQILGKGLTGEMVVKSPIIGSRTFIVDVDNPYARIPVMLEPGFAAVPGDTITFVAQLDNSPGFAEPGVWTGDVFSDTVGDPYVSSLDIGPLLSGVVSNKGAGAGVYEGNAIGVYSLLNASEVLKAVSLGHDLYSMEQNSLFFTVLEKDYDSDNNGYVDNFLNIGPGQIWQGKRGNRLVLVQNLTSAPKGLEANFQVTIAGVNITVPGPLTNDHVYVNGSPSGSVATTLSEALPVVVGLGVAPGPD